MHNIIIIIIIVIILYYIVTIFNIAVITLPELYILVFGGILALRILPIHSLVFSLRGRVGRNQSPVM